MTSKRINYLLRCQNHSATNCACCKRCRDLGMNFVEYEGRRGYYYKADRSIKFHAAQIILKEKFKISDFNLIALEGKISKKRMKILTKGKSPKRMAPVAQHSEEEEEEKEISITKRFKTNNSIPIMVERPMSTPDAAIKVMSRQILELQRGLDKSTRRLDQADQKIFKLIENQSLQTQELIKMRKDFTENSKLIADSMTTMRTGLRKDMTEDFQKIIQTSHQRHIESLKSIGSRQNRTSIELNQAHPSPNASSKPKSGPTFKGPQSEFPFFEMLGFNKK